MTSLEISTLGPLQITLNHAPASGFLSDKVRALLVYLALEQKRPLRREALAALFWPNQAKSKALANLRRALANLRQVIDDKHSSFLIVTRQTLQFNSESDNQVDAVRFTQFLGSGEPTLAQMETAVALAKGRFLEGFSIDDSIAFEEWALLKREQFQRQQLRTLNRLTIYYETYHQPETAMRYAWQQVNIEPWYEPGQRQLLRLLAQTGQRSAALDHYKRFREALDAELSVAPEPATQRLYEQIHSQERAPVNAPSLPAFLAEPPTASTQAFVAREAELAHLHDILDAVVTGHGQIVFVSGEAGSGKTSLLQYFARQAQKQQPQIIPLLGACQAHIGPGTPYLPLRTILAYALGNIASLWRSGVFSRAQVNRLWYLRGTAVTLLQEVAPSCLATLVDATLLPKDSLKTAVPQAPSQEILFEQMAHFLQKFSQHGPLLLLLDDLHWADNGTIDLLFYLRRQLAGYPILLLGAYRPEELQPSSVEAGRHPLLRLVHELAHDLGQIEIALNQADGRAFIDAWLDRVPNHLDESFRQTLFGQTKGQALFTVELVTALQENGALWRDAQGYWQVQDAVALDHLPTKTEAIVAEQFDRLSLLLRHLLSIASIQGESFVAELVAQVLQRPLPETIHLLSAELARGYRLVQAVGRQQIGTKTISRYCFRHNLFQQFVYGRLDAIERAQLHQLTGEHLRQLYETANVEGLTVAAELAYHFEAAQAVAEAVRYSQLAGKHALRLSAYAEAISHYRRSVTLMSTLPETPEQVQGELDCQLALGASLLAVQGYASPEVKAAYERAYALAHQAAAVPETVTSLFWLTSYYAASGNLVQAASVSQQMLSIANRHAVSDMHKMEAHVLAGLPLFFMGCNKEALLHFQLACSLYDPARHQPQVYSFGQDPGIGAMIWQGHVLLHFGYMARARRCLQQALDYSAQLDHPYTAAFAHLLAGGTPNIWYMCDIETAMVHLQTAVALAQKGNFAQILALGTFYLGYIKVMTCLQRDVVARDLTEGLTMMEKAMAMEAEVGSKLGLSSRWLILADVYHQCDQVKQAWHALRQAETEAHSRQERYFEAEIFRLKGALFLLADDKYHAEVCWQKAIRSARKQKAMLWENRAKAALDQFRRAEVIHKHF